MTNTTKQSSNQSNYCVLGWRSDDNASKQTTLIHKNDKYNKNVILILTVDKFWSTTSYSKNQHHILHSYSKRGPCYSLPPIN